MRRYLFSTALLLLLAPPANATTFDWVQTGVSGYVGSPPHISATIEFADGKGFADLPTVSDESSDGPFDFGPLLDFIFYPPAGDSVDAASYSLGNFYLGGHDLFSDDEPFPFWGISPTNIFFWDHTNQNSRHMFSISDGFAFWGSDITFDSLSFTGRWVNSAAVPAPNSLLLLLTGMVVLTAASWRRLKGR